VTTNVISIEEQLSGWYAQVRKAKKPDVLAKAYQQLADQVMFLAPFSIYSFTVAAIDRYERFKTQKLKIGKNDLRIASIVLENNAILVTRNLKDFQNVPDLRFEDWSV
jgi:tRNA(fMet)-specific endonuclease VapC